MSSFGCLVLLWLVTTPIGPPAPKPASPPAKPEHAGTHARSKHPQPPQDRWTLTASLGRLYDDNVIQLTTAGLARFERDPGPPRFKIDEVGDWSTTLDASLRWRGRPLSRRQTSIEGGFSVRRYDVDEIVDREEYALSLDQELTASQRHLLVGSLWTTHLPNYYLGEATDVDESVVAGRRVRNSLQYAQTTYGVRLGQDLMRGRLTIYGSLERLHRDYGPHFRERDNDNDQVQLAATVRPFKDWGATLRVIWIRGDLNARGDLPDTLGVTDVDISYDHDGVGAAAMLPWSKGGWRGRLDLSVIPEQRRYVTANKFDVARFGRVADRLESSARVTERITDLLDVIVSASRLTSRVSYTVPIAIDPSQTDFDQDTFNLALRARWDWRPH
jgi:hypothetical protein